MPKKVDHEERRNRIAEGLIRLAGRDGLHAVTMRGVAIESGVSLRLVQYYFDNKASLMQSALRLLERQSHERWNAYLSERPGPPSLRGFLETFFAAALPTDERSRTFHLVWTSFAVLAMTHSDLAAQPFVEGPNRLEQQLVTALQDAQLTGELAPHLEASVEAAHLLAITHGLGTSVLVGQQTVEAAISVFHNHLDRLLDL